MKALLNTIYRGFVILFCAASCAGIIASWYWTYIDNESPSRLIYQAEFFTAFPVKSRAEALAHPIVEAVPGQTVYRWLEWCLDRETYGVIERFWTNGELHQLPPEATLGEVGCFQRSVAHRVPNIQTNDLYTWHQRIRYFNNPLTTVTVIYPTITVRVSP